jgi:hypothetical protein
MDRTGSGGVPPRHLVRLSQGPLSSLPGRAARATVQAVAQQILVDAVLKENTHVGRVSFPLAVPEQLVQWLEFPDDVFKHAPQMGLDESAVRFLMAALGGKWALSAAVDLQRIATATGMKYSEMDRIVRELVGKNYARLGERLDLYRFWIVLLHLKGVRFRQR